MRIKYLKGDPRAGMVVEMDGERAKQLIAKGTAEKVSDSTPGAPSTENVEQQAVRRAVAQRPAKKAAAKKAK